MKTFHGLREQVYGNNNYHPTGPGRGRGGGSSAAGAQKTSSLSHAALSWSQRPTLFFVVTLHPVQAEMVLPEGAMAAPIAASQQLNVGGMGNSYDEGDEVEDFGPGAVDPGRLHVAGAPAVGQLAFEVHCAEQAARRASTNNAASYAMTEMSWSANDRAAASFLSFLAVAYGQKEGPGAEPLEQ